MSAPSRPAPTASARPGTLVRHGDAARLPVSLPEVNAPASAGQPVLAPPREILDAALDVSVDGQPFVFLAATMLEPGQDASVVGTKSGRRDLVPNALIVPLGGRAAKVGDLVVTSWHSGSGLQRALVTDARDALRPTVRYLDLPLDSPTGWGRRTEAVAAGAFRVLEPGAPGSTLACKSGKEWSRQVVISAVGDARLVVGFAGRLAVVKKADCRALALRPRLELGKEVFAPVRGLFVRAKLLGLDADSGRATVAPGGSSAGVPLPLLDVAPDLPQG